MAEDEKPEVHVSGDDCIWVREGWPVALPEIEAADVASKENTTGHPTGTCRSRASAPILSDTVLKAANGWTGTAKELLVAHPKPRKIRVYCPVHPNDPPVAVIIRPRERRTIRLWCPRCAQFWRLGRPDKPEEV